MSFLWGCSYKQRKIAVGWQTQSAALTGSSIVDDGGGVYVLQLDYDKTVPKPSRLYVLEPDGTPAVNEYLWASHYMKCTVAPPAAGAPEGILAMFGTYSSGHTPCLAVDNSLTTLYLGIFDGTSYKVGIAPAGTGTSSGTISALSSWRWIASRWKATTRHYEVWVDDTKEIDFTFDGSDSGTSTGTTATTMTDSGAAWTTDEWLGYKVVSDSKELSITGNTATVLTGTGGWQPSTPASGNSYAISTSVTTAVDMDLWALGVPAYSSGVHFTMRYKDSLMNDEDGNGITGRPAKDDYSYALLLPDGDYVNNSWMDEGSGTTNIYQSIDEIPVSGADYIQRADLPNNYRADFGAASPGSGKQVRAVVAYDDHDANETTTCLFEAALGAGAAWTGPDLDGVTGGDPYLVASTPGQWNMATFNGTAITTALYNTLNLGLKQGQGGTNHDGFALDVLYGPETAPPAARRIFVT